MTVSNDERVFRYSGNGATTEFSYPSIFFAETDLVVRLFTVASGTYVSPDPVLNGAGDNDYTIEGTFNEDLGEYDNGATVVFNEAPAAGIRIVLASAVPNEQDVALEDNSKFPAQTVNGALDRLTILVQQVAQETAQSLKQPAADTTAIGELPAKEERANSIFGWDADGDPVATQIAEGSFAVTAFIEDNLFPASTAAAARAALEAVGVADSNTWTGDNVFSGGENEFDGEHTGDGAALTGINDANGGRLVRINSTTIRLKPFNGGRIIISDVPCQIPAAGVSYDITGVPLVADTTYYVYAFMDGATMTLQASTTAYSISDLGVAVKSDQASRTLVGMVRPTTGPVVNDSDTQRLILTWYGRKRRGGKRGLAANRTTTSATYAEIGSSERIEFLCWAGTTSTDIEEVVTIQASGILSVSTASTANLSLGIDDATAEDCMTGFVDAGGLATHGFPFSVSANVQLSEGYHYLNLIGKVSAGTLTITGAAGAGNRTTLRVELIG